MLVTLCFLLFSFSQQTQFGLHYCQIFSCCWPRCLLSQIIHKLERNWRTDSNGWKLHRQDDLLFFVKWGVVHLVWQAGIMFFLFFFIEKVCPPVCFTVPTSLQARGLRNMDCNKGSGRAKRGSVYVSLSPPLPLKEVFSLYQKFWHLLD